jgi:hypothetical protein
VVLACLCAAVLFAVVPGAALALALAAAIGWSSWRLWPHLADGGRAAATDPGPGDAGGRSFRPCSERPAGAGS